MAALSTAVRRDRVDLRSMGSAVGSPALMTAVRLLRRVVTAAVMMRVGERRQIVQLGWEFRLKLDDESFVREGGADVVSC